MSRTKQEPQARRKRLAILVNTIAPYRLPVYGSLAESFETLVLHGGREANRSWTLDVPANLKTQQVWTIQIPVKKQTGVQGVWDRQYLHVNLGLLGWLPKFRPDAVLTNELGLRTLFALLYGRFAKVPVWVQWEGTLHSERNISGTKHLLRQQMAGRIRHWVSYGASSSEYLVALGVHREQVLEVQNCVPHEKFLALPAPSRTWFKDGPRPVILSVGQLIPRKGLHLLIAACARLAAKGLHFTLVLVGEGPEGERLKAQAARAGLAHFFLIPNQSQEALNEIYRSADAFVLPTLEDVWGLVVSEALWAGLPVLCSIYAGCAEVVAEENVFDPLSESDFDRMLEFVIEGRLAPADPQRMLTWQQVSDAMRQSITQGTPVTDVAGRGTEALTLG